jgi:formate hydrogenlyase subunit 6/NADH:ubiquinone oxidoreductase subunit I
MPKSLGVIVKEVLSNLFKKPATVMYPVEYRRPPQRFRGRLVWNDDLCIRCNMCERDCPADVLHFVRRDPEMLDKRDKPIEDMIAIMERCIYCGQCEWVCPKDAIRFEGVPEMAETQRQSFKWFVEVGDPEQGTAEVTMTVSSEQCEVALKDGVFHRTDVEPEPQEQEPEETGDTEDDEAAEK